MFSETDTNFESSNWNPEIQLIPSKRKYKYHIHLQTSLERHFNGSSTLWGLAI